MPKMMSKGFYIAGYLAGYVLFIVVLIIAIVTLVYSFSQHPDDPPLAALGLLALSFLPLIITLVVYLMFIYQMWAAIQDGHARTTPAKAAGFMLIPLFNFYWIFQAFQGFAEDYNQYIVRHKLNLQRLDEQLFLYYSISFLCTVVPMIGSVALLANVVLLMLIIGKTCDAVNALTRVSQAPWAASSDGTPTQI